MVQMAKRLEIMNFKIIYGFINDSTQRRRKKIRITETSKDE